MVGLRALGRLARRYSHLNWALADQALVSGSNVLTGVLLARFLGTEGFGVYTLAWAVLLFVASIHLPLIVGSMMSIGAKQSRAEAPAYFGAVIVQNLVFSVLGTLLVLGGVLLAHVLFPEWNIGRLALPISAATFATTWQEFFRRYFYTRDRAATAAMLDAVRYIGQISALLFLFVGLPGVLDSRGALWVIAGAAALPALLSTFSLGQIEFRSEVMASITSRNYRSAKWMVVSAPLEWASEYVFFFVTGSVLGTGDVGALRATQNVAAMTSLLFLSLLNVVPPGAARHYQEGGIGAMNAYLRRVTLMGATATVAVCLVLATFPEFWLGLLFGSEFVGYGELVRWWALVYTVNFFALPLRSGLRALERTRPVFISRLAGTVFAAAAAGILISRMGLRGAPIGVLGTKAILVSLLWWLFMRSGRRDSTSLIRA
ncbi:MAG: MATE family efflux transporter [Gemmatimonadota bacterium]|jgi:O-antigen/teichoic acid export membrane protein